MGTKALTELHGSDNHKETKLFTKVHGSYGHIGTIYVSVVTRE